MYVVRTQTDIAILGT